MINKKQIKLLKSKGYQILDEINFIKSPDIEPNIIVSYNKNLNQFELNIISTSITKNIFNEFVLDFIEKCVLVKKLNDLKAGD